MRTFSAFLYRLVLRIYPPSFRREFGAQMTDHFRSLMNEQRGGIRRIFFALEDISNLAANGLRERRRERQLRRHGGALPQRPRSSPTWLLAQDLRFGLRYLFRRPTFSLTAVLALALGIGASTAVFGLADVAWRRGAPPYPDADRVVTVWRTYVDPDGERIGAYWSWSDFVDARNRTPSFEGLALYTPQDMPVTGFEDHPVVVPAGEVTPSFAAVLGIRPEVGRWFLPEEEGPEPHDVVVLGHRFWQERLGGDPGVVGSTLLVDGRPYTVVGVVPRSFRFRESVQAGERALAQPSDNGERDLWLPVSHGIPSEARFERGRHFGAFELVARLKRGVSLEAAQAELAATQQYAELPGRVEVSMERRTRLELAGVPTRVLLLALPSALLLLLACANVATLLVGETLERRAELATRTALGAGKGQLVRQVLTESVLLGLAGSAAGTVVAVAASRVLAASVPVSSVAHQLDFSPPMLLVACAAGALAGLAFGLVSVLAVVGSEDGRVYGHMKGKQRSGARVTQGLITLQVAATCVLLVTGGLFIRTVQELHQVDLGFEPQNLVTLRSVLRMPPEQRAPAVTRFMADAHAIPEVEGATGSWSIPLVMDLWPRSFEVEDPSAAEGIRTVRVWWDVVMPDFHTTLGMPLHAGRFFTVADGPDASPVSVVSSSAAELMWPGRNPVGERIRLAGDSAWTVVVGVIGSARYEGYEAEDPAAVVYHPLAQEPRRHGMRFTLTARVRGAQGAVAAGLADVARAAHAEILVEGVEMVEANLEASTTDQRVRALLVLLFAMGAAGLAVVGIGGTTARSVSQRRQDLAVRYALGADHRALRWMVVRETLVPGVVGVAGGLLIALWCGRLVSAFLFGVDAADPLTFSVVATLLVSATALSGYLPTGSILRQGPAGHLKAD